MFDIVTISLSTTAGFIFFYVLSSYELRSRLKNTILIIIATILDTYPVFFGGMTESVTLLGAIHGLITMAAYCYFAGELHTTKLCTKYSAIFG